MVGEKKGTFSFCSDASVEILTIFADSLAGFQTYIVACLVWGMPSVQYGSPFLKNGVLIMLCAGAFKVKSGVELIIVWNDYVMLKKNGLPYCKMEFKHGILAFHFEGVTKVRLHNKAVKFKLLPPSTLE